MKFADLDKDLTTEAEAFDKKQGKIARAGTKLKAKLGPTKGMRQRATGKAEIQQQALDIKSEYMSWVGANDLDRTAGTLKQFLSDNNYQHLADKVDEIAVRLKFKEPEKAPEDEPKAQSDDSADQKADEVSPGEDQEELLSPEEMTGKKSASGEQSEEEVKAAYAKQGEELEAERKARGDDPKDDEVEEEVDMSASIYESRLAYFLIEEIKLKDNQLDTLLVRVLQAAGAGGGSGPSSEKSADKPAEKPKKDSLLKKAGKAYNKGMNVAFGDLHGRDTGDSDDDGGSGSYSGGELNTRQSKIVKNILQTVLDGKELSKEQTTTAKDLLREL